VLNFCSTATHRIGLQRGRRKSRLRRHFLSSGIQIVLLGIEGGIRNASESHGRTVLPVATSCLSVSVTAQCPVELFNCTVLNSLDRRATSLKMPTTISSVTQAHRAVNARARKTFVPPAGLRPSTVQHLLRPRSPQKNKKLSYRRGTARCVVSIEILPIATQQCRNYLYYKS